MKSLYTLLLAVGLAFTGCSDKKDDPKPTTPQPVAKIIMVQENGGPAYALTAASAGTAGGQISRWSWHFTGRLRDGRLLQFTFEEDARYTFASTQLTFARIEADAAPAGTTRTGQLSVKETRDARGFPLYTATGNFRAVFQSGLVLTGRIENVVLD